MLKADLAIPHTRTHTHARAQTHTHTVLLPPANLLLCRVYAALR